MEISPETINVCLQLVRGYAVTAETPDAVNQIAALVAARNELLGALSAGESVSEGRHARPEE